MALIQVASDIINTALIELGLGIVDVDAGNGDATATQALYLLNTTGIEILRSHDWQTQLATMSVSGDGSSSSFRLPDDFDRAVNQTQWANNNSMPMIGPSSPQMWAWNNFGLVSTAGTFQYRLANGMFEVFPVPGDGETFSLYYISSGWVINSDDPNGSRVGRVTYGADIPMLDSRLLVAGLKYRLWSAKGMDTTQLYRDYMFHLNNQKSTSQGAREISLTAGFGNGLIGFNNVPESGFGL